MILYNIPGRTGGVNILPETVVRLCREVPNIVGVKDATGNISQVAQLMSMAGEDVDLYSGNDDQVVPLLSMDLHCMISIPIVPNIMRQMAGTIRTAPMITGAGTAVMKARQTMKKSWICVSA